MGIIHYGQRHQNQQQNQQQVYNPADNGTRQSNADARTLFEWRQDDEEKRNDRTLDVSRVKVTPINVSTASNAQNSQYLFMGQLEELRVPTSGGRAEQTAEAGGRKVVL
jgi:hypothetical protein